MPPPSKFGFVNVASVRRVDKSEDQSRAGGKYEELRSAILQTRQEFAAQVHCMVIRMQESKPRTIVHHELMVWIVIELIRSGPVRVVEPGFA